MTMQTHDMQWQDSFRRVSRMLPSLSKRELDIIGDVADEFVKRSSADTAVSEGIRPLSEEELFDRIEKSVTQADQGQIREADEFEAEFDAELKAAYGI